MNIQKAPYRKLEKLVAEFNQTQSVGVGADIDKLVDFLLQQEDTDLEAIQNILESPIDLIVGESTSKVA